MDNFLYGFAAGAIVTFIACLVWAIHAMAGTVTGEDIQKEADIKRLADAINKVDSE